MSRQTQWLFEAPMVLESEEVGLLDDDENFFEYIPPLINQVSSTAKEGSFYQIKKGDTLLKITRSAYGVEPGAELRKLARLINDDPYNLRFRRSEPVELFPEGIISFYPEFTCGFLEQLKSIARPPSGSCFAIIRIPPRNLENHCHQKAKTISEYVQLVRCSESHFPSYTPRKMLSLLRQIYYGNEKWSNNYNSFWPIVIPCGHKFPNPNPELGLLFGALKKSQDVNDIDGEIDIGHVFAGLEAMVCPHIHVINKLLESIFSLSMKGPGNISKKALEYALKFLRMTSEEIPNEAFATWLGDLASVVSDKVGDKITGDGKSWHHYFGERDFCGGKASEADLNGDIDAYVLRVGINRGRDCLKANSQRIKEISLPISAILDQYYNPYDVKNNTFRTLRLQRYRCFVQSIGGQVSERKIKNRDLLQKKIFRQIYISSFVFILYDFLIKKRGKYQAVAFLYQLNLVSKQLSKDSFEIAQRFLNWLELKL
jgi:hypothetical protein